MDLARSQPVVLALALAVTLTPCAVTAARAAIKVNCNVVGQTISAAIAANPDLSPLVLKVKGTCTENVVIKRDDVTIKTNGVATATIIAANPAENAIHVEGAHRIVIDGVIAGGISISGGNFGVNATRNSTLALSHCAVTGATNTGIISSFGSTVEVDNCAVTGNAAGVTAANTSSLGITNSTVSGNTGSGITAVRNSTLRVGQDLAGTAAVKPVVVSGNGGSGITITESSAGNVVGGTIETSTATNLFIGRGSSGQIGLGSNNLTGGVTIQNGNRGISVEGANATIILSTISGHAVEGIVVSNGGSARIGVLNGNNGFSGNTISGNATGIGVFDGGSAYMGGNTVDSNTGFGINVGQGIAQIVGNNTITNNGQTGVFVRQGHAYIGNPGFGLATTNTISGNGGTGPNTGGIFAFLGGTILVNNATISNNVGAAVQAFEASAIELRGSTAITVPAAGTTDGASMGLGSTLRVRDTSSIVSATGNGIVANTSNVNIRDGNTVQGNGTGKVGISCFPAAPMTVSAVSLTGNLTGVSGTSGALGGTCNQFQ